VGEAAGEGARDDLADLPLISAGTEPNDLTPSCFTENTGAGEKEIGAETSSIEPKVIADAVKEDEEGELERTRNMPCLTAGTQLREMLTPSFMGTPWPHALGRREWAKWGWA